MNPVTPTKLRMPLGCLYHSQTGLRRTSQNAKGISGFSLLELLIASLLLSFLLLGTFHVYLSLKNSFSSSLERAVWQSKLQFVTFFLQNQITLAGFAGCGKLEGIDLTNNTDFPFDNLHSVQGFNSDNLPWQLKRHKIAPNTDVLVIQKADGATAAITDKIIKKGTKEFHATQNPATEANKVLLLADCLHGDLFNAIYLGGSKIVSQDKIAHTYHQSGAEVSRFTEIAYFLSSSEDEDTASINKHMKAYKKAYKEVSKYGLYYAINNGKKQQLCDGFSGMHIKYGVAKTHGKVDLYYDFAAVTAGHLWDKVESVVITLVPIAYKNPALQKKPWDVYVKLRERV
jgi:hypothetical protein